MLNRCQIAFPAGMEGKKPPSKCWNYKVVRWGGGESSYSRGRLSSKLFSPPRRSFNQLNRTRFENCQKLSRSGGMQSKFLVIRRWDPAAFNGTAIHGANLFPIVTCSKTDRFCGPSVNDAHHHNFSLGKEEGSPLPIERKQRVVLIVFPKGKRIKKNKKKKTTQIPELKRRETIGGTRQKNAACIPRICF